ncbi:hypothetical protein [Altericista sp. CCNU0014]|uniref:slr1601 family putative cell division protein n=1 Tax=Altericista sp. CCNU0014 TaxID=3082949 RepID=UPI00385004AA
MSALPNSVPSPRDRGSKHPSTDRARRKSSSRRRDREQQADSAAVARSEEHTARIWESGLILGVNAVLIGTAAVTLANLVPYQLTQRAKLQEIRREESQIAQSLQELQQTYQRSQSPETAQRIAQEQGSLMRANQLKVFQIPQSPQKVQ